ncbi:MAG TPA: phosphotransferase family protein [Ktedonobacteraceae bacterium]|nr:phosphotransferase family protein [Ktedonobacteraceae bacterium]
MDQLTPLINAENLRQYLARHFPGEDAPLEFEHISGGHSNETFFVRRGMREWVLRRPPRGPLLPTAHDVLREYRILHALNTIDLPVPRVLLACDDPDVIGASFYLMERVPGIVIHQELPSYGADPAGRRAISRALIDGLVALHQVDWQAVGLGNLSKHDGYLQRQLRRWIDQLERSRQRTIPELALITAWLMERLPTSGPTTIVHGDYRIGNVIYALEEPRVAAIVDWEMATLGDPLADVGILLASWREPSDPPSQIVSQLSPLTAEEGFFTRAEVAAYYAELTGQPVRDLAFYRVLALWKLAILLEGSYARFTAGTTDDPFFATLEQGVPQLVQQTWQICREAL